MRSIPVLFISKTKEDNVYETGQYSDPQFSVSFCSGHGFLVSASHNNETITK